VEAVAAARRAVERGSAWLAGLLDDLGPLHPFGSSGPLLSPRSEVIGATWAPSGGTSAGRAQARRAAAGRAAAITARIADRVRSLYGLSHTLAAPLHTEAGVIGAIVLSRRDREPWPDAARRLLEAAAVEAAAAMARAYSYREVAAHASTDPLTGLPNRRYFDEFCGLLARRRRAGDAVAVLMVDIDKFKGLNDRYGHPVGDEVLRAVAGAIVTAVREEDVPARVGGEEFAVLLRNPGPDVALEVGERVRQAVRALDLRPHGVSGVSVSVGVANARGADEPIPQIVERADQALLRAKRAGRDRVIAA
jgi:diguanylate cyclase (GGDEF)-like protein